MRKTVDYNSLQKHILRCATTGNGLSQSFPDEWDKLLAPYTTGAERNALTCVIEGLIDEGHLLPSIDTDGNRMRYFGSRGLTGKGAERLYQLEHPIRYWLQRNWFPAIVAFATILVSVATTIFTVIL